MDFTQRDFAILVSMSLFVIMVSFVFPAVGFTGENVNETDIPDFNASKGQFGYVNNTPEFPSRPSEGTLEYIDNAETHEDNRQVWLQRESGGSDYVLSLTNLNGTLSNPVPTLTLTHFNATGSVVNQSQKDVNPGDFETLEAGEYTVAIENTTISNANESDMTLTADWRIVEGPSSGGTIGQIPIIGGVAEAVAGAIARLGEVIGWIGLVIFQPIYNAMVTVTNTLIALYNIIAFFFDFLYWLLSTYGSVVTAAPEAWVSVFLGIPGIILSFEFAKILIIIIRTILNAIPFT